MKYTVEVKAPQHVSLSLSSSESIFAHSRLHLTSIKAQVWLLRDWSCSCTRSMHPAYAVLLLFSIRTAGAVGSPLSSVLQSELFISAGDRESGLMSPSIIDCTFSSLASDWNEDGSYS